MPRIDFAAGRRIEVRGAGFRDGGVRVVDVDRGALVAGGEDDADRLADR